MQSTEYLYNCQASEFADLPYKEALQFKLDRANELIHELIQPSYQDRDDQRINKVFDAQKFNKQLLEELK